MLTFYLSRHNIINFNIVMITPPPHNVHTWLSFFKIRNTHVQGTYLFLENACLVYLQITSHVAFSLIAKNSDLKRFKVFAGCIKCFSHKNKKTIVLLLLIWVIHTINILLNKLYRPLKFWFDFVIFVQF